uniref:protein-tyrosine-phosphatase n=1 Tax=Magallana gigas TaxID=29159 RepID=A0A8W8NXZ0_MAGGI
MFYREFDDKGSTWDSKRLRKFYLDVSLNSSANMSATTERTRCYTDNTTFPYLPPIIIDMTCKHTARYVIVETTYDAPDDGQETGPMLEICEIEVYGCEVGKYGDNCTSCLGCKTCDINNGYCACNDTFYGIDCGKKCGTNCDKQNCNHTTGECIVIKQVEERLNIFLIGGSIAVTIALIFIIVALIRCMNIESLVSEHDTGHIEESLRASPHPESHENTMSDLTNMYQNIRKEDQGGFTKSRKASTKLKRKSEKTPVQSIELKDDDMDIDEKIHEDNPYGNLCVNDKTISKFDITSFQKVIEEKLKNEDDGFKKEYATLPYGERHPCIIGKLPENIQKNRFKTTFPYDHSRVKLKNKQSDYVNANYIDGLKEDNVYIATQGPKQNTVADFWCMVWQKHIEQIIMLTNLMEGNTAKCFHYWPALETSMDCDSFTLNTTDERHYAYYVIRKLKIIHKKDNTCRTVTQYHYTAWPDHGIPEPLCLLLFKNHVTRTKNATQKIPVLVHCRNLNILCGPKSAGIGRTGTYIAIDALYEECKQKKINIAEYVEKMREKRMNMVQTYEQYKAIFLTLHEAIKAPVAVYDTTEFLSKLKTMHKDKQTNVSLLRKDFKRLVSICPKYTEKDYKMAAQHKDISSTIKPLDKYVLFLTSYVPKRGTYINAISLPSFTNPTAFIVTHFQTTDNAVDFLRLITDHDSKVVVSMEPLSSAESENKWMPCITSRLETIYPFKIQLQQERITEIKCCQVKITKKANGDQTWSADLIEPMFSLDPGDPRAISQIVGLVSFVQNTETEGPIIVISRDGAALCGVFCAVYNLIQQMTMDEDIDVFSVVRLLQTRRPELCSTMEEYILIHDVLMEFLRSGTEGHVYYNQ